MKKIISLLLVAAMAVSVVPMALATTDYSNGTQVSYNAEDPDGDGIVTSNESYTVTVPAQLAPGGSGTVTLSGTWASNRIVTVTADKTVTLINSINSANTKTLDVTFAGISKAGSNIESQTFTENVSVDNIHDALFGTWSGLFEYNVDIVSSPMRFGEKYILTYDQLNMFGGADSYGYYYSDGSGTLYIGGEENSWPAGTLVFNDDGTITDSLTGMKYVVASDGSTSSGYLDGEHVITWTHESAVS